MENVEEGNMSSWFSELYNDDGVNDGNGAKDPKVVFVVRGWIIILKAGSSVICQ